MGATPGNEGGFSMDFSFGSGPSAGARRDPDAPMVIALIADFAGRSSRGIVEDSAAVSARPPLRADVDNIDDLFGRLGVQIRLADDAGGETLEPGDLDALHPDELARTLGVFASMRSLRKRLLDPATSREAADEVRASSGEPAPPETSERATTPAPANDFERLVGSGSSSGRPVNIDAFVRSLVGEHVLASGDPDASRLAQKVDGTMTEAMRRVLRDPGFRATERAWRSLHRLITTIETDESVRVVLIDASDAEIEADLRTHADDPLRSGIGRLVASRVAGDDALGLLVWDRQFTTAPDDAALCARLGAIAMHAGAALLGSADPSLAGCSSIREAPDPIDWNTPPGDDASSTWGLMRTMACAGWVCLSAPRFILRAPYGSSDPIDAFDFEEVESLDDHAGYLWAGGGLLCAQLLASAYASAGAWDFAPGAGDIGSMPLHTIKDAGGSAMKPCAEAWLTDRAVSRLQDAGLTPVVSIKGCDAVRIAGMRSISKADGRLRGRWG